MNTPLFSIVIPLYNKSETICSTLESCIAQTFSAFEVIVVDDGSLDDSLQKVKSVKDSRIRILSQSNAGVSVARNRGIFEARGEWILCLDADDYLTPFALSVFDRAIRLRPELLAFVAESWLSRDNKPVECNHVINHIKTLGYWQYGLGMFMPNTGNAIIKSTLLKKLKYDTRMSFYEDQDLYLRVLGYSLWGYIPTVLHMYRVDTTNLSSGHHAIEREAAYYFNEREFKSLSQQLAYLRILDLCQWSRYVEGDIDGINYYKNLSKQKFSFLCRLINRLQKLWNKYKNKVLSR